MNTCLAYGATSAEAALAPMHIERRALRPDDVAIKIAYCGICHTDLHQARDDWHTTVYPCVPGHEIVEHVTAMGPAVANFAVGDAVAVGCLVTALAGRQRHESCRDRFRQPRPHGR